MDKNVKVCIVQPQYSKKFSDAEKLFNWELEMLDKCDSSMDIIVFPESSDIPVLASTYSEFHTLYLKYNKELIERAQIAAKRCDAIVFINAIKEIDGQLRNTTYVIDRSGKIVDYYFKEHLVASEKNVRGYDNSYNLFFDDIKIVVLS